MKKFAQTAFAALLTAGLAGAVLTNTTTQAAAWGFDEGGTWWKYEEAGTEPKPGILTDDQKVEDKENEKLAWGFGDGGGGNWSW